MKHVLLRTAGCLATSLALGIVEASRLILWNYGFAHSVRAAGPETALARTVKRLENAQGRPAPIQTAAGRPRSSFRR